jgi:hypothetical protein
MFVLPLCRICTSTCLLLAKLAATGHAQKDLGASGNVIRFDHRKECSASDLTQAKTLDCAISRTVWLDPGDVFTVLVENTYRDGFKVEFRGVLPVAEAANAGKAPGAEAALPDPTDTLRLDYVHDAKFGGYVVTLAPTDDSKRGKLGRATLTITVREPKFDVAFGGGFSLTSIRNVEYVARPRIDSTLDASGSVTSVDTVSVVREDPTRRDDATVGLASFVNVYHSKWPWVGPVIGLGIETGGNTQYYFGAAIRLGDAAAINLGYTLGRVTVLPAGTEVNDIIADANTLSNLGKRNKSGLFLGLSFKFAGTGAQVAISKPFAGTQDRKGSSSGS